MPVITYSLVRDDRMGWSTYQFQVDGLTILGLTSETGQAAADRLAKICEANADALLVAVQGSDAARERNIALLAAGKQGKDWPEFRRLDQLKNRLMKEAGIRDT